MGRSCGMVVTNLSFPVFLSGEAVIQTSPASFRLSCMLATAGTLLVVSHQALSEKRSCGSDAQLRIAFLSIRVCLGSMLATKRLVTIFLLFHFLSIIPMNGWGIDGAAYREIFRVVSGSLSGVAESSAVDMALVAHGVHGRHPLDLLDHFQEKG